MIGATAQVTLRLRRNSDGLYWNWDTLSWGATAEEGVVTVSGLGTTAGTPATWSTSGALTLPTSTTDLPSGTYTVVGWYEGEARITRSVVVPPGGWAEVDLVVP